MPVTTKAWVLHRNPNPKEYKPTEFLYEDFTFPDPTDDEVLVEPVAGCWEGNMSHAMARKPIDICHARNEERCVTGNAGVVRVLQPGRNVKGLKEGQMALVFCNGIPDEFGYPKKIYAYDQPNSYGIMAKRTKLLGRQLIALPPNTKHSVHAWAAFSLRYITAWSNWELAYGTLRLLMNEKELPKPYVFGWGGGVSLATLGLAKNFGCDGTMISSQAKRLALIKKMGVRAIDRREFPGLAFDQALFSSDKEYKMEYLAVEEKFIKEVERITEGHMVNIFIDYVGSPVLRVTLKTLARQGIVTTAGWKEGMMISLVRAIECIDRHQHIHTHYARYQQGVAAVEYAEKNDWMAVPDDKIYEFDEIPELVKDYDAGNLTCFPTFNINK